MYDIFIVGKDFDGVQNLKDALKEKFHYDSEVLPANPGYILKKLDSSKDILIVDFALDNDDADILRIINVMSNSSFNGNIIAYYSVPLEGKYLGTRHNVRKNLLSHLHKCINGSCECGHHRSLIK